MIFVEIIQTSYHLFIQINYSDPDLSSRTYWFPYSFKAYVHASLILFQFKTYCFTLFLLTFSAKICVFPSSGNKSVPAYNGLICTVNLCHWPSILVLKSVMTIAYMFEKALFSSRTRAFSSLRFSVSVTQG